VNTAGADTAGETLALAPGEDGRPPWRRRRRIIAVLVLVLVVAAVVVVIVSDPFGGGGAAPSGVSDNSYPTSSATVTEQALSQQTQVSGTLGYAGDSTIRVLAGNAPAAVTQAQQSVVADERMLAGARSSLSSDSATLAQARATLLADQQQEAVSCAGDNAAQGAPSGAGSSGVCATTAQTVTTDQQSVTADTTKVTADQGQVSSAERSLAGARAALSSAQALATVYGQDSTYTALPSAGAVIHRGHRLYAIDGQPVVLLYGSTVARRAIVAGMSPGAEVAELNANLDALGYGHGLSGDAFTAATAAAIRALQAARGMTVTGSLSLGSVVFEPGPVRVTSVLAGLGVGSSVMAGPVLTVSSTARQVTIALDAAEQGQVKVGDPVTITLPNNTTTPGRITYVSSVATSGQNGATVAVDAVPTDPAATGTVDQAPVNVSITTASVSHALVVPVDALLALSTGGYAVEEVSPSRVHHLVAVSTGLFDDADGLVAVTGSGLAAGQHVVVPGS
jgi:Putative peptidoglycan binding domain